MKQCPKCGYPNPDIQSICFKCQEVLPEPVKPEPVKITYVTDPNTKQQVPLFNGNRYDDMPPEECKAMNRSTLKFLAPIFLVIIVAVIYFVISDSSAKERNKQIVQTNFYTWKAAVLPVSRDVVHDISLNCENPCTQINFVLNKDYADTWYTSMSDGEKKLFLDRIFNSASPISKELVLIVFAPDGTTLGARGTSGYMSIDR